MRKEVPYKLRSYALRFCNGAKVDERMILKRGKYFSQKFITGITIVDFIKEIGRQLMSTHGVRKFSSALLQAAYYDDWSIKKEQKIKIVRKRVGKTKFYTDSVKYVYALETELEDIIKEIDALERLEILSIKQTKYFSHLQIRRQRLETKLHKNIQYESDEQLMERALGWLESVK